MKRATETHCANGHPWNPDTIRYKRTRTGRTRYCARCQLEHERRRKHPAEGLTARQLVVVKCLRAGGDVYLMHSNSAYTPGTAVCEHPNGTRDRVGMASIRPLEDDGRLERIKHNNRTEWQLRGNQ